MNGTPPVSQRPRNQQISELVKKFDKAQGMTVKAFCKLHQISEGSFFYYRGRQVTNRQTRCMKFATPVAYLFEKEICV